MPARYLPQPIRSLARRWAPRRMIGVSSSLISCSPESHMKPNTGETECSPSACERAPWPLPLMSAQKLPVISPWLGDAAINEGRGLIILRGDNRRIAMRQAVAELVHRDGPDDAALEQRHQA